MYNAPFLAVVLSVLAVGCASAQLPALHVPSAHVAGLTAAAPEDGPPIDSADCKRLADAHLVLQLATPIAAGLGGVGGLGSLTSEDPGIKRGLVITAAVAAGVALATGIAERSVLAEWRGRCVPDALVVPLPLARVIEPRRVRLASLLPSDAPTRAPSWPRLQ